MRSLTDEAKEIVRVFMADGKVATRKMVAEQVEKNISRPNEYRVNILNGVIKVLTENHELDVVERGKYQLGKGLAKRTHEELAVMYLMNCKENMGSLCSIEGTDTSEDKKQFIMKVTDTVIEIDKLLVKFKGDVKAVEGEKKEPIKKVEKAVEKPVKAEPEKKEAEKADEKAVEKAVKAEKKEPEKKKETVKADKKEAVKAVEKKAVAAVAKKEKKEPAKAVKKEEAGKEVKAEPSKPVEKTEPSKKAEAEKEKEKGLALPAVVKKEEAPKAEQKPAEKKEVSAK